MPGTEPKTSGASRLDDFDPKETPLSGLEVFALVLPILGPIVAVVLSFAVRAWAFPADAERPDWAGWLGFSVLLVIGLAAGKYSEVAADRLLLRIDSPLSECNSSNSS